jgi:uncharacterized surface protein with fasciclin (FAS1) repeats
MKQIEKIPIIYVWHLIAFSFLLLASGCDELLPELHDADSVEQTIMEFVTDERYKDSYSLFGEIMEKSGLRNLLSVRGPYTLFLPDNNAVAEYMALKGMESAASMNEDMARELVLNHLTDVRIFSSEIGLGALIKVNALGDFLSSEFDGPEIYINKESRISKRDIITANGIIHAINKVIEPVHDDVATILASKPGYTIFNQGLQATGVADTLKVIEFPYGNFTARTRYTLLAVSDEVYNANGIFTLNDLVNTFTDDPTNIDQRGNEFFHYMEYHCLRGTYYLSHFSRGQYPNIANENYINFTLDNDYEINKDLTGGYTSFYRPGSNIPAKNGVIHTIDNFLIPPAPSPWRVVFDVTDYIDFRESDFYKRRESLRPGDNIFQKFYDGNNTFEFIKWEGDYLQYYYRVDDWKVGDYINGDCLKMTGYWSIEITTPRIMKGKYEINAFTRIGPDCLIYIDGVLQEHLYKMTEGGDNVIARYIGTVDWSESTTHTIKLVNLNSGQIFYDRLEFTPVFD